MKALILLSTLLLVTLITRPSKWIYRAVLFVLGWAVLQNGILFSNLVPLFPGAAVEILEGKVPPAAVITIGFILLTLLHLSQTYKSYISAIHVEMYKRFGVAC